jgi:hypothetical protein
MTIRAHFDGRVFIPDEPVDLPVDSVLELDIKKTVGKSPEVAAATEAAKEPADRAKRLAALAQLRRLSANDPVIPLELLRREHLYD